MASSGGHILVPKAMRLLRYGFDKAARLIRDRVSQAARTAESQAQPAYARVARQPTNRLAAIKQSQSRWRSTKATINNTVRHFSSSTGLRTARAHPASRTATAVSKLTSRAPFASQLRPNLTGGTLMRSAGGYGLGGGARTGVRYFSHSPAAPAQVVNNVSQAVRAFWLSGSKARFDGFDPKTGNKRFRAVSDLQDDIRQTLDMHAPLAKGSFIDFKVSPTITAIGPLANIPRSGTTTPSCESVEFSESIGLNNPLLMSNLSIDFARALKDLAAIFNDLKRLSTLGDLPVTLHDASTLRVRFPGCDIDTVESLCLEFNIHRGIVGQDPDFATQYREDIALLFPFAPSRPASETATRPKKKLRATTTRDKVEWQHMLSPTASSPRDSHRSQTSHSLIEAEDEDADALHDNLWLSTASGYSSLHASELDQHNDDVAMYFEPRHNTYTYSHVAGQQHSPDAAAAAAAAGYEGLEGIHRFLQECERAQH